MILDKNKTEWDLSPLMSGDNDPMIDSRRELVREKSYEFINKWKNRKDYLEKILILKEALDELEVLNCGFFGEGEEGLGNVEGYYFWLRTQQDQNDSELKAKYNRIEEFSLKIVNDLQFFELNLGRIPEEKQKEFLRSDELKNYRYYLERLFEKSKHLLSDEGEKIMNMKSASSRENWIKMVSGFISKEEGEVVVDGKKERKNFEELFGLLSNKDKVTRGSAGEAINNILDKYKELAEAEMNSILANKKVDDELRSRPYADYARHLSDNIEKEIVDSLIASVTERFELSKRFYALKAKLLGVEKINYYERNVSVGAVDKKYSYGKSLDLIYDVFSKLDSEFASIMKSFVEEGRIDAFPRKGKSGGAFCVYWLKSNPVYILLNHTNKLNDVTTIAHELGHGINNEMTKKKQNSMYFGASTASAEVASTFMEDFVFERLMRDADEELKLNLIMDKLNSDISSIVRQIACYKFERELHKEFDEKGYLSHKEIGEIFSENMDAYMGDAVDTSKSHNWWIYWSHIRNFFYTYSYSSGLLISKALQKKVRADRKFIECVKEFLSAGSSASPKEIFIKMGVDISQKDFWNEGLSEVENLLVEAESLAKKLGKI